MEMGKKSMKGKKRRKRRKKLSTAGISGTYISFLRCFISSLRWNMLSTTLGYVRKKSAEDNSCIHNGVRPTASADTILYSVSVCFVSRGTLLCFNKKIWRCFKTKQNKPLPSPLKMSLEPSQPAGNNMVQACYCPGFL